MSSQDNIDSPEARCQHGAVMRDCETILEREEDEDLDKLLDSALQDFDRPLPRPRCTEDGSNNATGNTTADSTMENVWTEEFIKKATSQFEQSMRALLNQGDSEDAEKLQHSLDFEKFTEEAAKAATQACAGDCPSSLTETLKHLSENAENLQKQPTAEELTRMLSQMGVAGAGDESLAGDLNNFMPFMETMMQSLLSKDLLYPALKDLTDKYPDWLADNRSQLENSQYEKYNRQFELMKQVCEEFEGQQDTESEETSKETFDRVLRLMQKMQDCGDPPRDLVGDMYPLLTFDEQGNPHIPGLSTSSQCAIM